MFNEFHHQVRGRGHESDGTPGQDRTAYLSRGGVQALCLADGAGSALRSQVGAQVVVQEGCAMLVELFTQLDTGDDAAEARRVIRARLHARLESVARRWGCAVDELASTFLAVAVSGGRFVVVHIGDGVVGYVRNGEPRVVSGPDNSEFANQTTFVTSAQAASSTRLFRGASDGVTGFILMSDGASASLFDQRSGTLAPACAKLMETVAAAPSRRAKRPEHEKRLRRVVDTRLRLATKDDCSIAILARRP
ncbi:PP2C family serine/threonine-protein phosphatase [Cellulomonas xiejunii]|uniref:PP2C family serine/threonine-protein phosphatase n=1 Tax=Cellulomonas xiejunii TaxID=2968083 RepID=UPI001D0F2302|nr:PP2C family serine/threonine-protein phosphatase [Cellulomonas xiejunii]MCC2314077.1 protein phosphatase 2C domain-containing protein [Cellulomonas xiejunii]